jgi:hypothetical protein
MPTDWPQPRPRGQEACSPEGCASDIGRIIQHAADRGGVPTRCTSSGLTSRLAQASADLAQAHSIQTDRREDEPNDVRLLFDHLETRHSAALSSAHVAIPEGSPSQRTDGPALCGMAAATPAALQDFGPLVFGDYALNLEQEIVLRGAADRAVEESNLRARAAKLIDEEHLMGVTAGEPVRSMDIDALDMAAGNCIS